MYLSCFAINFSLHAIICEYLISLLIIISIKLYLSLVAKFVDLNNLIIKFIVTLSHDDLDNS
jgi:hypothetical protein